MQMAVKVAADKKCKKFSCFQAVSFNSKNSLCTKMTLCGKSGAVSVRVSISVVR